jgi:hypothetical protein
VITFARRSEAAKTEQILEASPEHILGEDKSTLPHERGQQVGLGLGKGVRINAGIEDDEAMAEGLWEIASDKKRNAHLFQRVDEWERILWIGAGAGPEYRDLKRERFWKLLKLISVLMRDFEQWDFFGSQGRRGVGGDKFPNGGAPAQSEHEQRNC